MNKSSARLLRVDGSSDRESPVEGSDGGAFVVEDCALAAIATGLRSQNLREFRDQLRTVHPGCVYYHFWGALLRPQFENPEYLNDFAEWAYHGLRHKRLAERLGVIDPGEYQDMEQLRTEVIEVVEETLDESEMVPWAKNDRQFHFIRSQIVVFDTHRRIRDPRDLVSQVPLMSASSIFYHFIDARRRTPDSVDDFRAWLRGFGDEHQVLIDRLATIDPYFVTLSDLREQLSRLFHSHFQRGGL